jgi:hypothetical protein
MKFETKKVYNFVGILFFLFCVAVSLLISNPLPLVAGAFPLMLLNRAYVLAVLLTVECVKGAAVNADQSTNLVQMMALAAAFPLLLYDLLKRHSMVVPFKLVGFYILFPFLVILGFYIWLLHPQIFSASHKTMTQTYFDIVTKIFVIIFMFIFLKVLINYHKELFYESLQMIQAIVPFMIIIVFGYTAFLGRVSGALDVVHFGDAHHGEFTADLCASGAYLFIPLFDKKRGFINKLVIVGALLGLLFVVMKLGSRNGVVTFALMSMICMYLVLKKSTSLIKMAYILGAVFALMTLIYIVQDSPTIERFIVKSDEGGGDRIEYWTSGLQAIAKEPVFGLGGDESSSMYAVSVYAPGVVPNLMHNTFLEMTVEYGFVGFIFYFTFFFTIMRCAYKSFMYALRTDNLLIAMPSISYSLAIFAGMFISRIWQLTVWYNATMVFAVYILWVYPIEQENKIPRLMAKYSKQRQQQLA